jgi:hypothetical protein
VPQQLLHPAAESVQPRALAAAGAPGRLPLIIPALAAHLIAWSLLLPLHTFLPAGTLPFAQGLLAAALGHAFRLPRWWLPLNLLLVPAGYWLDGLALPPALFLATFLALVLLFWTTYSTRVPLFLSSAEACEHLRQLLPSRQGLRFIDLGCGLGDVLARLAPARQDAHFVGVEVAPLPTLIAWLRIRRATNARVFRRSFWQESLADYDVVYAFLSPAAMPALWSKARAEMKPGSLLISNSFAIPGVEPLRTVSLGARGSSALYVWQL